MKNIICLIIISWSMCFAGASYAVSDRFWGFCKDGKAFSDEAMTIPKPDADKICRLPDAFSLGETSEAAIRCFSLQEAECQIGAGGNAEVIGDQNVPRGAYFLQSNPNPEATGGIKQMRCMCGCFTPDIVLDSTAGKKTIFALYEQANEDPFRLLSPAAMFAAEYNVSEWLSRGSFTVGPEENPVWKFYTESGENVTVTEKHPMVVVVDGEFELRIAKEVKKGDIFVGRDGLGRAVTRIEHYKLQADSNLVYNLNTKGERALDHLIVANGILVGDLYLQNLLGERQQRVENIQQVSE